MLYNLVNFIVAVDKNFGIGKDNEIPWYISEELKYFKKLTEHNVVVMGSKTFFSIPIKFRPLKNRFNIVLTNNKDLLKNDHKFSNLKFINFKYPKNTLNFKNYEYLHKLISLFSIVKNNIDYKNKEIFIIGGEKIYKLFFELFENTKYYELQLNKIYLTYLDKDYKCDTFFKKLTEDFKLKNYSDKYYNKNEDVYFRYCIYEKDIIPKENCKKIFRYCE